ncbi:Threonine/homoserine/homoserine lactone efflux protein [Streptomyces zhaozhouensis]|uniref:Threonine/homoserine/homoserine lactone efflux protein n=1 Tax=Streptomyces zhaozhouensis TaxID=1300267 RepID=A0A286DTZ9_9ACTN|nr:LysE family translocator [Streptomyces zhaozhouensis]SOD62073.1 Threonine/homoserine/homoserine lactone efflux protein [Streptomyces zhaozhouensis]
MITTGAVAGVAAVALGMVLTPGPNMIYLVSRSLTQGRTAGLVSLSGVALGFLTYLTAANLGLSVVFAVVPGLYLAVKLAGACYLGWLAWQTLRPGGTSAFTRRDLPPESARRLFGMGLMTCLLNPKIALMYLSLIPQFVDPEAGHVMAQGFLLGGVQVLVGVAVNGVFVLAAGAIAAFLGRRPGWLAAQRYVMGGVLGGLAVHLALDTSRPTRPA